MTAQLTGLEQNKIYNIKVVVKNKKGTTEKEINEITGELRTGVISQKGDTIWTGGKASIELETTPSGLTMEYQVNGIDGTWTPYGGAIGNLNHKDKVYARITDGINAGETATVEIRDAVAPTVTVTRGTVTSNSVAVTVSAADAQWGMPTSPSYSYYIKKVSESDYGAAKYTGTDISYTFTGLTQATNYDIKVTTQDKAGNEGTESTTAVTEGVGGANENLATGNITASSPVWNSTSHTASVTLSTTTDLQIQWQKNGIDGTWATVAKGTKSTTISSLNHNDKIYARLYDGVNAGNEAYVQVKDGTAPTVKMSVTGKTSNSITVSVEATDNEWGMPTKPTYSYYIKEDSGNWSSTPKYTGENASYTFTGLKASTFYWMKVITNDKAGNEGKNNEEGYRNVTEAIGGASENLATGNITASSPVWDSTSHTASITLSTTTDLQIQWQENGIDGAWTTVPKGTKSITISSLNHNDKIYARLYDGVNSGSEAYVQICDDIPPVIVEIECSKNFIAINVSDGESGLSYSGSRVYIQEGSDKLGKSDDYWMLLREGKQSASVITPFSQFFVRIWLEDLAGNSIEEVFGPFEGTIITPPVPEPTP